MTIILKFVYRIEICISSARQRYSFELVRWHIWRSCGLIDCVPAAFSFRKLYVAGLRSAATPKYVELYCYFRNMAVVLLPAGQVLSPFSIHFDKR